MADEDVPNLSTRILVEIRDELKQTNARLDHLAVRVDGTNARLDHLAARIDGTNERIDHLAARVDGTNERIDNIERKLPGLLTGMEGRLVATIETWLNRLPVVDIAWRQGVEKRLVELEKKTG